MATRRYDHVSESLAAEIDAKGKRHRTSSVWRRWKQATEPTLAGLMASDLSAFAVVDVMVDAIEVAGQAQPDSGAESDGKYPVSTSKSTIAQ